MIGVSSYLVPRVRVARLRRGGCWLFTLNVWYLHTSPRCQCAILKLQTLSVCGLLEFNVPYHVAAVAVPFAVLLAGGFLLDPYQSSPYQLAELSAPSYEFCGSGLAEHNIVPVEH